MEGAVDETAVAAEVDVSLHGGAGQLRQPQADGGADGHVLGTHDDQVVLLPLRGHVLAGPDGQVVESALEGLEHLDEIGVLRGQHQLVVELQVDLGPLGDGGGGVQILGKVLPGGLELVCQILEPGQVDEGPLLGVEEGRLPLDGPPGHEQVLQGLAAEVKDEVAAVFAVAAADGGHQAVFLQPLHRPGDRGGADPHLFRQLGDVQLAPRRDGGGEDGLLQQFIDDVGDLGKGVLLLCLCDVLCGESAAVPLSGLLGHRAPRF